MSLLRTSTADGEIAIEDEISLARLTDARETERRLRYGAAIVNDYIYGYTDSSWADQMASWLFPAIAGKSTNHFILEPPPETSYQDICHVSALICILFISGNASKIRFKELLRLLLKLIPDHPPIRSDPRVCELILELEQQPEFQSIQD